MVERRKHPRTRRGVRVHWQLVRAESDAPDHLVPTGTDGVAMTRDMSSGGISFTTPCAIEVGSPLWLELDREFGGPPVAALGRVARCDPDRDSVDFVVGVELTWIECTGPDAALGVTPDSAWTLL